MRLGNAGPLRSGRRIEAQSGAAASDAGFDLDQGSEFRRCSAWEKLAELCEEKPMAEKMDELIPSAKDIQKQAAIKEAEKADQHARASAAAEAEKRALIEKLSKPSGLSEEEKVKLASTVIQRAVRSGLSEVQVYRFPNILCTDRGRAINQQEAGWEKTLTGIPKEIFQLWSDYLKPRGYRIRYQIIDFPGGMPGDVGITISWKD
jgi:hypothetical protein